ncbi:hypothetical protein B0H17DRAFT_184091 [Mycena rosella]|uniref:Uncharacterized protein n=1 Tax=Mycena rosella TaxID=1033263 RepID=A0AAD7D017_MYCRO|nr:hypothetical protein B0H17DRAFT_184091 [Mycena rosella]
MSRLPSSFTSLYRLFLRTSTAAVLHQPRAAKNIRKLWRPTFDDGACVTAQLQAASLSAVQRSDLEIWLKTWHARVDNTLAMLYTSSKTHGLSHRLTRNLGLLVRAEQHRINRRRLPEWKANPPANYNPERDLQLESKKQLEEAHAWDAIEEVVRMAEGRNEIVLGRISLKRTAY